MSPLHGSSTHRRWRPRRLAIAAAVTVALGLVGFQPASAAPDGSGVVINEAFLSGGSSGAAFNEKFIELYNPTDQDVSLDGWSLQYRAAGSSGSFSGVTALSGTIKAGGYYLVAGGSNGTNGADLPTPDVDGSINPSGTTGTILLANVASAVTLPTGSISTGGVVVDLLGYGGSNTFEGALATAPSSNTNAPSFNRSDGIDTDNNLADFTLSSTITPTASDGEGGGGDPDPDPEDPQELSIAEIQGTGDASPFVGQTVTTSGVVTAVYPTGGFNGFYLQTEGTGGTLPEDHDASHAIFVYGYTGVQIGDHVRVTGGVSEFNGLTEITVNAAGVEVLAEPAEAVKATVTTYPRTADEREDLEGMLLELEGDFVVSDPYPTNQYGEIILASGTSPLVIPTDLADPGSPEAAALVEDNLARRVVLDDGATTNFLNAANQGIPVPYLSLTNPVRSGAAVNFVRPVILDYRNNAWKFQPTTHLTPANADEVQPAAFENTRTAAPEPVGGTVKLATFNVLNYFTTTGDQLSGCTYYRDRDGNPITVNSGCDARGAANAENLARQEAKIVAALSALDADVVGLEEIESSTRFGKPRDAALADLVEALNEAVGAGTWAYVPSPSAVPAGDDVIRTAFIYKPAVVELVGESVILDGSAAFSNAREPLAQAFKPVGEDGVFVAIVNHFKSKSSGGASGPDADQGDGQGAYNAARVAQATALVEFADQVAADAGTESVFLLGDFNAYGHEDPVKVIEAAGYVDQASKTGKSTYVFGGEVGSLDHIFASTAVDEHVTGVDVWNINAVEALALEYSRYNYNVLDFYDPSPYRSSDHDPVIVGFDLPAVEPPGPAESTTSLVLTPDTVKKGATTVAIAQVQVDGAPASGQVEFRVDGKLLGTVDLVSGLAGITVGEKLKKGTFEVTASYLGSEDVAGSSASATLTVTDKNPPGPPTPPGPPHPPGPPNPPGPPHPPGPPNPPGPPHPPGPPPGKGPKAV